MRSRWWAGLCVLTASAALAQYPYTRAFQLQDGNTRPDARLVIVDPQGMIWVGGEAGLFRTDGDHTRASAVQGSVTALATADRGVLAAFADGLLVRAGGLMVDTLRSDTAWRKAPIRSLCMDVAGSIWIGTYGDGLWRMDADAAKAVVRVEGLFDDHVNALCPLPAGGVAAATDLGIVLFDAKGRVLRHVREEEGATDNLVLALTLGDDGHLWAGTDRRGVFHFDPNDAAVAVQALDSVWSFGAVSGVHVRDGLSWVATRGHGVRVYDLRERSGCYMPGSEVQGLGARVLALSAGKDGAAWWCDGSARLFRSDANVLFVPQHEGVDLRHVSALCSGPDGRIHFAVGPRIYGHAAAFADAEHLSQRELDLPAEVPIVSLHADSTGDLWAGTMGRGVFRIRPDGTVQHFTEKDGLANNNVLRIRSRGDAVWMATLGGVAAWSAADGFVRPELPGNGFLYDLLPLPDGGTLVASDGGGLVLLPEGGGPGKAVGDTADARPTSYYSLALDEQGNAWACGPGTGLCVYSVNGLQCTGADHAVLLSDVQGIAAYRGRILAFAERGLLALEPGTGRMTDLGRMFGLEGVSGELNALCTDLRGGLWVATNEGLVRITPTTETLHSTTPVVLVGWSYGKEPLSLRTDPHLGSDQNFLTFHFASTSTPAPDLVRFQYRLVGFDGGILSTREREITYSRLPPGAYEFQIRAGVGDTTPDSAWTSFAFTIDAPWWRRPWAVFLGVVLLSAAFFGFIRMREERLRLRDRMEKERVRFQLEAVRSQVNPHFLFNSFNTLIALIEEDTPKAVRQVEDLSTFFRNILQVRDKDLIPLADELRLLETYFGLEQRRFGERIRLVVDADPDAHVFSVVPLTLQLLVENALKHNSATTAQPLIVRVSAHGPTLEVRNTLRPRLAEETSTAYGLDSIRQRYRALTDRPVEVFQEAGDFVVRIPLITAQP
ncbi:MAG: histidine kinase [Flavobacteriales bacterium]|nr:histidine kinase [Flavobacteriales bacterium]